MAETKQEADTMTPEQQAFLHDLYIENYAMMLSYARARTENLEDAEDVAQEAFCIACGCVAAVIESPNRAGWLMQTLKFALKKQRDAKKKVSVLPDKAGGLENVPDLHAESQLHTVEYAVLLGEENYDMLDKAVLQRAGSKELAAEWGIKDDTCRKRLERLRVRLRRFVCDSESS